MPDVYDEDIQEKNPLQDTAEQDLIGKLLDYTKERLNPFKADWDNIISKCYNFIELKQWEGMDIAGLAAYGVPEIAIDRIGRARDTINGIRANTGNKKKIVKRETGDERIAEVFDKAGDYVEYSSDLEQRYDTAFDNVTAVGLGLTEIGWDQNLSNGEGDFYFENIEPEDCGWSFTKLKDWSDIRWAWKRVRMDWEAAVRLNPSKAGEIKTLRTTMGKKWEEIKDKQVGALYRDYESSFSLTEGGYVYPSQVEIYVIWLKRIIPFKKVVFQPEMIDDGMGNLVPQMPQVKKTPIDYQTSESELELGSYREEGWYQYIIACGSDKKNGILLTPTDGLPSEFNFHPFCPMIADYKKTGMPRGFVESVIGHQQRINLAWAQKMAYNNKSIKSPIVIQNADPALLENKIKQTAFGAVMFLGQTETLVNVNLQPNVNLQAIEEGNIARQDMDFAAAASEPVLRGQSEAGASGLRLSKQQDAAITPLNKWVKAESLYKQVLWRKILQIMIKKYDANRLARIIGIERFTELLIGKRDPLTGQPLQPPLQFPVSVDVAQYDVIIQDKSLSDFQKAQAFNAALALHQSGFILDAEYMFTHAPIENPEEALASHNKAEQSVIKQLMEQNQVLMAMLKMKPQEKGGGQNANAQRGRSQPQQGQRMQLGGQLLAQGGTT